MKYKRQAIDVDAVKWTGKNFNQIENLFEPSKLVAQVLYANGEVTLRLGVERALKTVAIGQYIAVGLDGFPELWEPAEFERIHTKDGA